MKPEEADAQGSALDQFVTEGKELTNFQQAVGEVVRRGPWWVMSLAVHVVALWVMYQWPVATMGRDQPVVSNPVAVNVLETSPKEVVETPPALEEKQFVKETVFDPKDVRLDLEIKDVPITNERVSPWEGTGPGSNGGNGAGDNGKDGDGKDLGINLPDGAADLADRYRPIDEGFDPLSNTPVFGAPDPTRHKLDRGMYKGRFDHSGGHYRLGGGGGTSAHAESCLNAALIWLAKAQDADGHWDCRNWEGGGNYDVGMTGLAVLAYLGAGYTHTKGRYKDVVAKGLDWLRYNQKPNGAFGYVTFYEQGIATMAVSEAYGMTHQESLRTVAQKAVDFIIQTQPDHGGFRYAGAVDKESGDMSVTGWQILALKSAICSELNVPVQAIDRSREFLKNTAREYGGSAYIVSQANATPAMSAIGMLCREFIDDKGYNAEINAAANYLMDQQKKAAAAGAGGAGGQKDVLCRDLYYTYYSVMAMIGMGLESEYWIQWNKAFRDPLLKLQETKNILDGRGRFVRGSWDPKDTMWGAQGGRVFSTAMSVLCLEAYYRFLPVIKRPTGETVGALK